MEPSQNIAQNKNRTRRVGKIYPIEVEEEKKIEPRQIQSPPGFFPLSLYPYISSYYTHKPLDTRINSNQ